MKQKDVDAVHALLTEHLAEYEIRLKFSKKDVTHFFLPQDKVIYTYVIEQGSKITDFFSFYYLPSSILKPSLGHDKVNVIIELNCLGGLLLLQRCKGQQI